MVEISEILDFRKDFLDNCKDSEGFVTQYNIISEVMPLLLETKYTDTEDFQDVYFKNDDENLKLNSYTYNSSGERLQLFIVDENTIKTDITDEELLVSQRSDYLSQFSRVGKILKKAFNGNLSEEIQDSDPLKVLAIELESKEGFNKIDVIEIFLISFSVTTSFRGSSPEPIKINNIKDEKVTRHFKTETEILNKEVLIQKKIIDMNYLFDVMLSRGYREVLTINFDKSFGYSLEAIKAADNKNFESYLCVFEARVISDLYKKYSTRLLEKNIRSFLDFRGVNKGIKETIKNEPEKFIAYNNGLTITATNAKTYEKKKILYIEELSDFQIVNGGQTTASIYFSQKDGLDISNVKVMAKINIVKQTDVKELDKLINNISKFSNAQTKVTKVDLNSRDPQLLKIKQLSDSVLTPSGYKWFFERSKGEFNVLLRKAGKNKNKVKKEFPPERRFTKELLGKYYCAWGDEPFMVKKGGERIFRNFIEHLSPDEDSGKEQPTIDRNYYEDLIAKVILFRDMENIYGVKSNAIGQIRSAVIPYSLSIIYINTDLKGNKFDMSRIWKKEGLEDDLSNYLYDLMELMNDLIKKYATSDDLGEYSKKVDLWNSIKNCSEINDFINSENSAKIINAYTLKGKL